MRQVFLLQTYEIASVNVLALAYCQIDIPGRFCRREIRTFLNGLGNYNEWNGIGFKNQDVLNLTNDRKLPFVIACACRTGRYQYAECIGECWARWRATGYIGANRFTNTGTYTVPRDFIDVYCDGIHRLGQCATAGMDTILLYNMFADPGMRIWGDVPKPITCLYKDTIPVGPYDFAVLVKENGSSVSGATVCLTSDIDSIFSVGKTDGAGHVLLSVETIADTLMYVTVTSPFHIPHEGTVVISDAGIAEDIVETDIVTAMSCPNPLNGSATIRYQLSTRSRVSLKVYDISGRTVRTLIDDDKEAGNHNTRLDTQGLADGIYFIRFQAGEFRKTRKITVLRGSGPG